MIVTNADAFRCVGGGPEGPGVGVKLSHLDGGTDDVTDVVRHDRTDDLGVAIDREGRGCLEAVGDVRVACAVGGEVIPTRLRAETLVELCEIRERLVDLADRLAEGLGSLDEGVAQ